MAGIALVAGCSSAGSDSATGSDPASGSAESSAQSSGDGSGQEESGGGDDAAAALPSISGEYGQAPEFDFGQSQAPEGLQVEVLSEGDGPAVQQGVPVLADYAGVVWGQTEPFDSSFSRGAPALFSLQNVVEGWSKGIPEHKVGSRLLISIPPDMGYGSEGNSQAGIGGEDTIVFVVDIVDTYNRDRTGQADAKVVTPTKELPVEVGSELGQPASVTVPDDAEAPEEVTTTVIAEGSGEAVAAGDTVAAAYAMSSWDGSTSQTTWTAGEETGSGPIAAPVGQGSIVDALIDVPVGSRVLVLVPKTEQAPPAAFVIDILAKA